MRVAKFIDEDGDTILISPNNVIIQSDSDDNTIRIKDIGCDDESGWLIIQGTIDEVENELNYALSGLEYLGFTKKSTALDDLKRAVKIVGGSIEKFDIMQIISAETADDAMNLNFSDDNSPKFVYIVEEDQFYCVVKKGGTIAPYLQAMTTESPLGTRIVLKSE